MFTFIFDRDADFDISLRTPSLYAAGPKKVYFNFRIFWKYMGLAFVHGLICYIFPMLGFDNQIDETG